MKKAGEHLNLIYHHITEALQDPANLDLVHYKVLQIKDLCDKIEKAITKQRGDNHGN